MSKLRIFIIVLLLIAIVFTIKISIECKRLVNRMEETEETLNRPTDIFSTLQKEADNLEKETDRLVERAKNLDK